MLKDIKFILSIFIIITLLTIKEMPYINLLINNKFWIIGIMLYVLFSLLFIPSNLWLKYKNINYFIIITFIILFIFTMIPISILSEILGIILYGLFWFLVIYKISIYLKSSSEKDEL